jgi:hypothetical protein
MQYSGGSAGRTSAGAARGEDLTATLRAAGMVGAAGGFALLGGAFEALDALRKRPVAGACCFGAVIRALTYRNRNNFTPALTALLLCTPETNSETIGQNSCKICLFLLSILVYWLHLGF